MLGASGIVEIGDNVFIGMNSIIERNVKIGDNVVIGAGSVVTKDCEKNSVYAGVPARKIMDIDTFFEKRKKKQLEEARNLAVKYYERYGCKPPKTIFHEYFMLFETNESARKEEVFYNKLKLGNIKKQSLEYMQKYTPVFSDFEEFMRYCFEYNEK